MEHGKQSSRRSILKQSLAAMAIGSAGRLPVLGAAADRVLVCIYLVGGNDSNNMLLPAEQYSSYASARAGLALPQSDLLTATSAGGATYLWHPALGELRDLFQAGVLGVVSNVGSVAARQPRSGYQARLAPRPPDFLSHAARSIAYLPEGFLTPAWALRLGGAERSFTHFPSSLPPDNRGGASLIALDGPSRGRLAAIVRGSLQNPIALRTQFPATRLAERLQQIGQLAATSGLGRQVYLVPMAGYNTATNQLPRQQALFQDLSQALSAFYQATVELGVSQRVTTYTDTEFNRTLMPNNSGGTDPGWGGHHLVMGGAVLGGEVHGEFPSLVVNGPHDATGAGVWAPFVGQDDFSATLAEWLGVHAGGTGEPFPDLPGYAPAAPRFLT